jgi:hypothetical protein
MPPARGASAALHGRHYGPDEKIRRLALVALHAELAVGTA